MQSGKWKRVARTLASLAGLALAGAAQAVVTASGANPSPPGGLNLNGVGAVSNSCSSVLLEGGGWLLGAAHCAAGAGATVSFASGATATITDVFFAPDWLPAEQVGVNDLALMRLATPPVGLSGFAVAAPSLPGTPIVLAGYGYGGNGLTGGTLPGGSLRFGFNQYEFVLPDAPGAAYAGRVVAFDFDDGTAALNRFGSLGFGEAEAMVADFDSGGPSFVFEDGIWKVGGIHVGRFGPYGSTFGGIGFDLQPGYYSDWIQQVTAVPEAASGSMFLFGLGVWGWVARRRRA